MPWVGSEVVVVFVEATRELAAVEVTLEGMAELMKSFPVGEGEDLLTMEQIGKMNVVIIAMIMVELSSHFFIDMHMVAFPLW